jgi:hypothetical protein
MRRLAPILPPFRPIAAITREISDRFGLADSGGLSAVDSATSWWASWLKSLGLFGLLKRFGIDPVCHGGGRSNIPAQFKVAHYRLSRTLQRVL